jgi:di/tricarboxylate transporter
LWFWIVCGIALTATVALGGWYIVSRVRRERTNLKAIEEEAAFQRALEEKKLAQLKTVTPLATLLEINQDQIDQYHRIATEQADRSFRSSQRAMAVGLAVVVACLAAGIYLQSSEAKIFV